MRKARIVFGIFAILFVGIPFFAHAQTLYITPTIVDSSDPVEQALKENEGRASTSIEGKGAMLSITYTANEPLEVYMVPLDAKRHFVPTDFLRFTLPATEEGDAVIDLTVSPGWSPSSKAWILNLLTKNENVEAGFSRVEFLPASLLKTVSALLQHFFTPEAYTPASYHALRGYRIFSIPVVPILGILTTIIAIGFLLFSKQQKILTALLIVVCGSLFYQLRFSVDLLRFNVEHLKGYAAGTYDEAGSAYLIAEALHEVAKEQKGGVAVYICRDGTSYKEKIIRYMAYPLRIAATNDVAKEASFAVVTDKNDWSLRTETKDGASFQTLRCGALKKAATKLTDFPDGSILFSLAKS